MAENQDENKVVDADLEKAQKSMGGRMDPDEIKPTPPVDTPPAPTPDPKDITPPPATPPEEKKPGEDIPPANDPAKKVDRPQAYIPMPKYLSEKAENERLLADKDTKLAEALKKVEELTAIANKDDGAKKDDDIEEFMNTTGFSREVVEGLLKLAEKRILKPEQMEALKTATDVVKEAELEAAYNTEFETSGAPELKKRFPTITAEQMEKAKSFLDQVAHTPGFHDKQLDFIIYKHLGEIEKLFGDAPENKDDTPPQTKKTIEGSRMGAGKNTPITVKDFEGQTDFSLLNDMDPSERNLLIRDMPIKMYENFKAWANTQDTGTEVMRDGKRVILK